MNQRAVLVYILLFLFKAIAEVLSTTGSSALPTSLASSVQDVYQSVGCFNEPDNVRALNGTFDSSGFMNIQFCLNICNSEAYLYAGMEDGDQCFCANVLTSGAALQDESYCNLSCQGNSSET